MSHCRDEILQPNEVEILKNELIYPLNDQLLTKIITLNYLICDRILSIYK